VLAVLAIAGAVRGWRTPALGALIALIVVAGLVPQAVDRIARRAAEDAAAAENARFEADFLAELDRRQRDVAERSAGRAAYTPAEMLDLVAFADSADLGYRSLPDHSAEAMKLLGDALAAGLVDPNARLDDPPVAKHAGAPLFVYFHAVAIKPVGPARIEARDWDLLGLLVKGGADLDLPEAAEVRADLARTAVPRDGGYVELR
jgi:hypothetical protein